MDDKKSEFNAGVETLKDIGYNWRRAMLAAEEFDPMAWYMALLSNKRILNDDMKPEERIKCAEYARRLHTAVVLQVRKNLNNSIAEIPKAIYDLLSEFEEFLRSLSSKYGYKTKYSDDASEMFS